MPAFHTFNEWKAYGYIVNKGEKADNFYEEDDDKYFDKQAIFEEKLGEDRID